MRPIARTGLPALLTGLVALVGIAAFPHRAAAQEAGQATGPGIITQGIARDAAQVAQSCPAGAGDWARVAGFAADRPEGAAAAVTNFLPARGAARIAFVAPPAPAGAPAAAVDILRVFAFADVPVAAGLNPPPVALEILSVKPVPTDDASADYVAGFGGGLLADLRIPDDPRAWPWETRTLLAVGCSAGKMASWALVKARVSYPAGAAAICTLLALACYLLSMTAVYVSGKAPHPLAAKYPAVFASRELRLGSFLNPIHLTADAFNRASLQKLQVILFSFLIGWLVLLLVLRTGSLTDLSLTVVGLLGISGVGAVTAQATYQQRTRLSLDNWAWLNRRGVFQAAQAGRPPEGPRWRDLVLTNRAFDVYKLQTVVFTIAVAVAIIAAGASHLATFTVPQSLLGVLGLSQVVYVGGILVRPPAAADLDAALTRLRQAEELVVSARELGSDIDPDSPDTAPTLLPAGRLPAGQEPAARALRRYRTLAQQVAVMIESTLEITVDPRRLSEIDPAPAGTAAPVPAAGPASGAASPAAPAADGQPR